MNTNELIRLQFRSKPGNSDCSRSHSDIFEDSLRLCSLSLSVAHIEQNIQFLKCKQISTNLFSFPVSSYSSFFSKILCNLEKVK